MKINRLKRTQASLTFYRNNFGFHPPYKVLIDRTFCNLCINLGFDLTVQISKYLQSDVALFTTRCVIKEMEKIGEPVKEALKLIKTLRLTKCIHAELDIRPAKCFLSLANHESNAEHYFIATQNVKLLKKLDDKIACPYISIKLNALFLNKPTQVSKEQAKANLDNELTTDYEMAKLKEIKKCELGEDDSVIDSTVKRKKKVKGKHPLSCRKKKFKLTEDQSNTDGSSTNKKRKKKKNLISKHIRKLLKSNNEDV